MLPNPGPAQIAFEWSKEGTYRLVILTLIPLPPLALNPQIATSPPADTGLGAASESGATNTLTIVLGGVALTGILGAGSRVVLGRRQYRTRVSYAHTRGT